MRNISDVLNTVGRWTLYGSNGEESHITIIKKGSATLNDGVVTLSGYEGCKPSGFTVVGVSTTSNGGYEPHLAEYNSQPCYAGRVTIKSKDDPRYAGEITEDEFYINLTEVPDRYFAAYVRVFYDTGCGLAFQDTNVIYLDELTERVPEVDEGEVETELPEVTEEDNGKFLGVVNGEWVPVPMGGVDGDCQLPGVTETDNGKVPQVVDGALVYTNVADLKVGDKSLSTYIADAVNTYIEEALGGDY
jgi:hypothetical protein